jgi:hypothetical protein
MTLVEVVVASVVLGVVALLTMSLLTFNRIQSKKAMDRDIMLDFAHHYLELARAAPYANIAPNQPINPLYDGVNQILLPSGSKVGVTIKFPASDDTWRTLWTTDFRYFHPDLAWMENRGPEYKLTISTQSVSGVNRAKRMRLDLRWRPPLRRGNQYQTLQMDTVVYPEFN